MFVYPKLGYEMNVFVLLLACFNDGKIGQVHNEVPTDVEDIDGDGFTGLSDCDETSAANHVGAIEICDGIDNNCDGAVDENVTSTYYGDADADGFGNEALSVEACEAPEGFVVTAGDCDDGDASVFPGALENCDGVDNNCDGEIDENYDNIFYADFDGDGFGNPLISTSSCEEGEFFVGNNLDCDDQDDTIHPNADEYCDEIDNNCDGSVDNNPVDPTVFYFDQDSDGYGVNDTTIERCQPETGYVVQAGDCDDQNPLIHPYMIELCNEIDENCNELIDEGAQSIYFMDADEDGYGNFLDYTEACSAPQGYVENGQDCDDTRSDISPIADEYCDGVDNDCDTLTDENNALDAPNWYADVDQDGYGDIAVPFQSCNAPQNFVINTEDCDDGRPNVNPSVSETCTTAYDDNCDGSNNDENASGCLIYHRDSDLDGYGDTLDSLCICTSEGEYRSLAAQDCDDSLPSVNPGEVENCSTPYDDDCDGDVDDAGAINCSYFYYDYDGDDYGTSDRLCLCSANGYYSGTQGDDCDDENAMINPSVDEVCDSADVDENCDGIADGADAIGAVDWYQDGDGDLYGDNTQIKKQCDQPIGYLDVGGDCDDSNPAMNPGEVEHCSVDPLTNTHRDEDCSGSDNDPIDVAFSGCVEFYYDGDQDGYGDISDALCLCYSENNYTSVTPEDCDDSDAAISPGKNETCLTSDDDDCDGSIDEPGAEDCTVYFYDADNDGYGVGNDSQCLCAASGMYRAALGGDCDDTDPLYNSGFGNCGLMGNISTSDAGLVISGRQSNYQYQSMQFAGNFDYNNDGIPDIAVIDREYDTAYTNAGALFLYLGPVESSVDVSTGVGADLIFTAEIASENVGIYGVSVGNWDSDPFDEIFVNGYESSYLIDDSLNGQGIINESSSGVTIFNDFGPRDDAIQMLGDVNGDGITDVVRQGGSLFFGDGANGLTAAGVSINLNNEYLTLQTKGADLDGDGLKEWIGVNNTSISIQSYIETTQTFSSHSINGIVTSSMGRIETGDFDGDGYQDLVASHSNDGYDDVFRGRIGNTGVIRLFPGSVSGIVASSPTDASWQFYGELGASAGNQLVRADVDGDAIDDLIITQRGVKDSYLFYGPLEMPTDSTGAPRTAKSSDADTTFLGLFENAANAGEQNQDGLDDLLIGGKCSGTCVDSHSIYLFYGALN